MSDTHNIFEPLVSYLKNILWWYVDTIMLTKWRAGEQTRHLRFLHHNSTFTLPLAGNFLDAKNSHGVWPGELKMCDFFVLIGNPVYNLAKDPVGIWTKIIFTDTTIVIELKLGMNNHWIALYKTFFFCWYKIQDGWYGRTNWTGGCYEENVCKIFFFFETPKPRSKLDLNVPYMVSETSTKLMLCYQIFWERIYMSLQSIIPSALLRNSFGWYFHHLCLTCIIVICYDYLFNRLNVKHISTYIVLKYETKNKVNNLWWAALTIFFSYISTIYRYI